VEVIVNVREGDLLDRATARASDSASSETDALIPELDDDGILRLGDAWVALSPIETRLARAFLDDPGRLLGRKTLGNAGWPDGVPNDRSVDSRIKTLRRRVAPLGLQICTIRGRGYLADLHPDTTKRGACAT
jgi:DNA-binding response OmpR family regulator